MNEKILITGSTGFIGNQIYSLLKNKGYNVFGTGRKLEKNPNFYKCDLQNEKEVKKLIKQTSPSIIIHSAALTNVDLCEKDKKAAYSNNVKTTINLINNINKNNIHFIYISSDYVYSGKKGPYKETSSTNPINYYGKTKLLSENIIRKIKYPLILRTGVVFGYDIKSKNFLMQLLQKSKLKEEMLVAKDQISNPTHVKTLCLVIEKCINKKITGTYNLTGQKSLPRDKFAKLICKNFNIDTDFIKKVKTKKSIIRARRPLDCSTNSSKIQKKLNYKIPKLKHDLQDIKSNLKKLKQKEKLFIITKNDLNFARNEFLLKAIKHLNLNHINFNLNLKFLSRQIKLFKKLIKDKNRYDLILLTSRCKNDILTVKLLSLILNKKLIVDVFISSYDSLVEDRKLYKKNSIKGILIKIYDYLIVSLSDAALLDTYEHINYFKNKIKRKDKYHKIVMGSDEKRHKKYHKIKNNSDDFTIVYNGTYIPLHGVEYIIEAAKKLENQNIQFLFFGKGQVYKYIRKKANEINLKNVKFIEEFNENSLCNAIRRSNIFLGIFGNTPKAKRVVATKVFKGMALKKCIITARSKAMDEIFVDGHDYMGVNFADSNDLAKKILYLKNNKKIIEKISNQGYNSFLKKGDIPAIAKDFKQVLKKI
jgi:dTDP-4-dehydrorhamnose reductase